MKQTAHARGSGRKWYVTNRAGDLLAPDTFKSKHLARQAAAALNNAGGASSSSVTPTVEPAPREELFAPLVEAYVSDDSDE